VSRFAISHPDPGERYRVTVSKHGNLGLQCDETGRRMSMVLRHGEFVVMSANHFKAGAPKIWLGDDGVPQDGWYYSPALVVFLQEAKAENERIEQQLISRDLVDINRTAYLKSYKTRRNSAISLLNTAIQNAKNHNRELDPETLIARFVGYREAIVLQLEAKKAARDMFPED
jgi:hypothetical protein